jgi:hypothetical protein
VIHIAPFKDGRLIVKFSGDLGRGEAKLDLAFAELLRDLIQEQIDAHLAQPKPKTFRAWKDRSEVPVGSRVRLLGDAESEWILLGTNGKAVYYGPHYGMSFSLAIDRMEWSSDGQTWQPCGVET